ncbi:hypothetical protein DPM19_33160 [Actinomadura craniellae]|uniref:Sensor domain-containing protein n=2 Tax=Actinomadura craniellae TaxID=2231787 RepID=A0A365GVI4_9ACTN|nr:hypothetical protein DPM19_33160 [Actinomadura craniellae]
MAGVLSAGLVLGLPACAAETHGGQTATETAGSASGSASPQVRQVGGGTAGFTLDLPAGWTPVDPATDQSALVRTTFGITTAPQPELLTEIMKEAQEQGGAYALDPASANGDYAAHLSALCSSAGLLGNSIEALKNSTRNLAPSYGAENLQIADVTVAGKPGIRITYARNRKDGIAENVTEIKTPAPGDKSCNLSLTARQGSPIADLDRIIQSFRPE